MGPSLSQTPCILVVDDHAAVRQGLKLWLADEGLHVCAEAENAAQAMSLALADPPSLALVDLSLGDDSGLGLIAELAGSGVPVVVYSMHEAAWHVERAFAAGAGGYVTKRDAADVLALAIREVLAGRRYVSPRAGASLADQLAHHQQTGGPAALSRREQQVLDHLGRGDTPADTAAALGVSARTVESYCARIIAKLGLNGMAELRRHAIRSALPPPP